MILFTAAVSPESVSEGLSRLFLELGLLISGLALLARLAYRFSLSPIPLYLIAGLAFGTGGFATLGLSEGFVHSGSEIGVILLLFMLGVEYTAEELTASLRASWPAGLFDLALNLTPGLLAGLLLGWGALPALLLGGITYISSSGVIAKVLADLGRLGNRETPVVLSILVMEDLAMAVYLPLVAVLLLGSGFWAGFISMDIAVATVGLVFVLALRYGKGISRMLAHSSEEVVLLSLFGLVLVVAGVAQRLQVSAAVGAFLVGIALGGSVAEQARRLLGPLRDLFAAVFFIFFGLQIDPATLPPALGVATLLGLVTTLTKLFTGWWAARRAGIAPRGCFRAGAALVARGEFSIVIAGLGVAVEPRLGALAAAYVLLLAVLGPVLARVVEPVMDTFVKPQPAVETETASAA